MDLTLALFVACRNDGKKLDGTPDARVSSEHGLGADRERASELGKQGGKASGGSENEVVDEDYDPNGPDPAAGLEPAFEDAGDDSTGGGSSGGDYK